MKKIIILLFAFTCIFSKITFAESKQNITAMLASYPIFFNGVEQKNVGQVYNVDGKIYIPLRTISEMHNSKVEWNNTDKSIIITKDENKKLSKAITDSSSGTVAGGYRFSYTGTRSEQFDFEKYSKEKRLRAFAPLTFSSKRMFDEYVANKKNIFINYVYIMESPVETPQDAVETALKFTNVDVYNSGYTQFEEAMRFAMRGGTNNGNYVNAENSYFEVHYSYDTNSWIVERISDFSDTPDFEFEYSYKFFQIYCESGKVVGIR